MTEAARRAAERLARPGLRVLDVGAGAAPWSLAIVGKSHPAGSPRSTCRR
jgi:ubiquinone/menaquinone biosynthesis C-methylase UbiE